MYTWNVEEMKLMNENDGLFIGKTKIFGCEQRTSREDKIAFVDSLTDGRLSHLLSLIEKFNKDKETLPKDDWGSVKTVSLKAWIKRNDTKYERPVIDDWFHYGKYHILGCERYIQNGNSRGSYDTYDDLVDECFHRQLLECRDEEKKYFSEHDEYSILKKKFRNKNYITTFGVNIGDWSDGRLVVYDGEYPDRKEREITMDELKDLLSKYEQLDALVEKLTAETHIVYDMSKESPEKLSEAEQDSYDEAEEPEAYDLEDR